MRVICFGCVFSVSDLFVSLLEVLAKKSFSWNYMPVSSLPYLFHGRLQILENNLFLFRYIHSLTLEESLLLR